MSSYDIKYEILDYDKYYKRLNSIYNDSTNRYKVIKHNPIGYTDCGFPIEHYSIGNGPMHIIYMGGAHGNEIIGVDFVTQLMSNLAKGNGSFSNFNQDEFTIDFIPCQNPEGFFTTTYALNSIMGSMDEEKIESFSKKYYSLYAEDDDNVININKILSEFCLEFSLTDVEKEFISIFWQNSNNKDITCNYIIAFILRFFNLNENMVKTFIKNKWIELFNDKELIPKDKKHHEIFSTISLDCIPKIDDKHIKLRNKLAKIYSTNLFPIGTLANFFSNADGVNLNDNNEYYYNIMIDRIRKEGNVYGNFRDNNLLKNVPGPIGMPSESLSAPFKYTKENQALLDFIANQEDNNEYYAFINCHSTGGLLYVYPVADNDLTKAHETGTIRDLKFYINGRLATDYSKQTEKVYEEETGEKGKGYQVMGYPNSITGVGDCLRKKYIASFLLELSKMGGNPIAPYGDRKGNYYLTMKSNFNAASKLIESIKEISHLYDISYFMYYDETGRVHYEPRKRK